MGALNERQFTQLCQSTENRRELPRNRDTRLLEADSYRSTLHSSEIAHVEDSSVSATDPAPNGYEAKYQVVLPYFGFFSYVVGRRPWLTDSNRTLFISPGWEFQDEHPVNNVGHASILINPARELLEEICGSLGPDRSHAFTKVSLPSSPTLRILTQHMLHLDPEIDKPLYNDEWVVRALREAIQGGGPMPGRISKAADRAKQALHARCCERITLGQLAADVGVSPVYLTQEFCRAEGMPLYRYQLRLRLNRALLELPHCNDITGLALDLGFSSHSHFTCTFRRAFGISPSTYRDQVGTRQMRASFVAERMRKLRAA